MICRYDYLRQYPTVFLKMTGLRLNEFADLLDDCCPAWGVEPSAERYLPFKVCGFSARSAEKPHTIRSVSTMLPQAKQSFVMQDGATA